MGTAHRVPPTRRSDRRTAMIGSATAPRGSPASRPRLFDLASESAPRARPGRRTPPKGAGHRGHAVPDRARAIRDPGASVPRPRGGGMRTPFPRLSPAGPSHRCTPRPRSRHPFDRVLRPNPCGHRPRAGGRRSQSCDCRSFPPKTRRAWPAKSSSFPSGHRTAIARSRFESLRFSIARARSRDVSRSCPLRPEPIRNRDKWSATRYDS